MAQVDKPIARSRARPPEASHADVRRVLEHFGWVYDRESGSHVTFVKEGELPIGLAKVGGRTVKCTTRHRDRSPGPLGADRSPPPPGRLR